MQRSKAQKHITSWLPWPAGCACLLLMLLSTGLSIQAQDLDSRYLMTQIMVEGLPQNSINAIVQTRDGYLWMTTFGGLVRFDGISYTVFDVANTPAIATNRMVALFEDRAGVLWIGHESGDLTRYQDAVFSNYTEEDGLPGTTIRTLAEDQEGNLWGGTDTGLFRLANEEVTVYTIEDERPLSNRVFSLLVDHTGTLWVGMKYGLARFTEGQLTGITSSDGLSGFSVGELLEDQAGTLWVGTAQGLFRYTGTRFVPVLHEGKHLATIGPLAEDRQGTLWVSTADEILAHLETTTRANGARAYAIAAAYAVPFDATTIVEDREGNLWIGTSRKGLFQLREKALTHLTLEDGIPARSVFRITTDGADGLWISSGCSNLTHYYDGTFINYHADNEGIKLGCNWALLLDHEGALWLGRNDSLSQYQEGVFTTYNPYEGLPGSNVVSLFEDQEGIIWIGTMENGVAQFDGEAFTFYTTEDGLAHNDVRFIMQSRDGALWIGTGQGVSRLKDGVFTNYTAEDGLPRATIRSIHEDEEGVLWFGSYGGGLARLKDGRITHYTMEDGLFDNTVSRILEDERGNLWMLGNLGLFYVAREQLNDFAEGRIASVSSVSFGPEDGMIEGNGGGQPAGWQTDDGKMWFPTIDGMMMIDAKNFQPNGVPPPVAIEHVMIDGQPMDMKQTIEAPPGQGDLVIHYTGLSFVKPEAVRFKYKLEGYDPDWLDVGTRRDAFYTNIPPGTYTFRVMAANSDGVWNEEGASLAVTIHPPWWRTTWAYLLYGLLFIAGVFVAERIQRRRLIARERERTRERELEQAREIERAHTELQQSHAHLKATQAQLVQQAKMASLGQLTAGIAHEIKNPLNFVNNFSSLSIELADELHKELDANIDKTVAEIRDDLGEILADLKQNAARINEHGRRADGIVNAMMQHASGGTGEREKRDINALVSEQIELAYHGKRAQMTGFKTTIERDLGEDAGTVEVVPQEIGRVLLNLLGNAFDAVHEHTVKAGGAYAPMVTVSTRRVDGQVKIWVSDNGPGIPETIREKIFEPFFTTKPTGSGTGLGLSLSYDIVTQGHGGTLTVESTEGEGATFVITLPSDSRT